MFKEHIWIWESRDVEITIYIQYENEYVPNGLQMLWSRNVFPYVDTLIEAIEQTSWWLLSAFSIVQMYC